MALRCKNWLWSIEGILRRLIIASAMTFGPLTLKTRASQVTKPRQERETDAPRRKPPSFRIFAIHSAASGAASATSHPPAPIHRHLFFPADDLLRIGSSEARNRQKRAASFRRHHPLDRRRKPSRFDPDYCPVEIDEFERYTIGGDHLRESRPSKPPAAPRRDLHSPWGCYDDPDWRRIEEEWKRIIPAPDLARRILAIARVLEAPGRWIERTARKLQQAPGLARRLSDTHAPMLKKPKRDPLPEPFGLDTLFACHQAIPQNFCKPDTS
jgi:hypothetical protein